MTLIASGALNGGDAFARRWVVEVLLELTEYTLHRDLGSVRSGVRL